MLSCLVYKSHILVLLGLVTLYQLSCQSTMMHTMPKSGQWLQWPLQQPSQSQQQGAGMHIWQQGSVASGWLGSFSTNCQFLVNNSRNKIVKNLKIFMETTSEVQGSSANSKRFNQWFLNYLAKTRETRSLSHFEVGQITQDLLIRLLRVGRGPLDFWGDLSP